MTPPHCRLCNTNHWPRDGCTFGTVGRPKPPPLYQDRAERRAAERKVKKAKKKGK